MSTLVLESIKKRMNLDSHAEYIGVQVFWTLAESEMSWQTLHDLAVNNGFGDKTYAEGGILPSKVTPCGAWKRAVAAFKKSDYVKQNGFMIDHEDTDEGKVRKGLLTVHAKSVDGVQAEVSFQQKWAIEFDKAADPETEAATHIARRYNSDPANDGLYILLMQEYRKALDSVNLNDVRETIKRILKSAHAFSMRPSGGIYFVPAEKMQTVKALRDLVSSLPGSALFMLELPKSSQTTVQTVQQTAAEALEAELEQLATQIETGIASIKKTQAGDMNNTSVRLQEMLIDFNSRADFYGDMISMRGKQMSAKIEDLTNKVIAKISEF